MDWLDLRAAPRAADQARCPRITANLCRDTIDEVAEIAEDGLHRIGTDAEEQGLESGKLADALETTRQRQLNIHGPLLVRNDGLVVDASFYPYTRSEPHDMASVTKSVTTLIGIAADRPITRAQGPGSRRRRGGLRGGWR